MRRRDKAGKAVKAQRRKTLRHRNALKVTRRRNSLAVGKETNVARLTRELSESRQHQTATSEILASISGSITDAKPVFDAIVRNLLRLFGTSFASVQLLKDGMIELPAAGGTSGIERITETYPRPLDDATVGGQAMLSKRVVQYSPLIGNPRVPKAAQQIARDCGYNSIIAAPMMREGKVIGAIACAHSEPRVFSEKEVALIKAFADQAVIAIENVRLFEAELQRTKELSEALEQQTATSEVLKVISSFPGDLKPVFEAMLDNASRICEADAGNLFLCEPAGLRAVAVRGEPQYVETWRGGPLVALADGEDLPINRIARTKSIVHIADLRTEPAYVQRHPRALALVDAAGARTLLNVPLLRDNELVGVFGIFRRQVRPFTDKQIELVQNFAAQAVIAIENTRLLSELRESLQQQTATADVLKVISRSTFDLRTVLNTLTESATRLCEADKGAIMMRDGDLYQIRANYGFADEAVQYALNNPLQPSRGSATGRAALEGKAIHIPDVLADPEYRATGYHKAFGYRSMLAIPLLREGTTIGTFTLTRDEVNPFTEKQKEIATTFADQAVIAIENARLFDEVQTRTKELTEALEQQTAMSEVLRVISSSSTELAPVFDTILANATRLCDGNFAALWQYDGEALVGVAQHNLSPGFAELCRNTKLWPGPEGAIRKAALERRTIHVADITAESGFSPVVLQFENARTVLAVPLLREKDLVGIVGIWRREVEPFTEQQIALVRTFADQAVIAIENARLLSELRESLQQQTATADVLKVISSSTFDLQPVLDTLVESATRLCEAYDSVILLRDGQRLRVRAHYGPIPVDFADWPIGRGWVTGRAFIDQKPIHVHDLQAAVDDYPDGSAMAIRLGHRAILATPLMREDEAIGALMVRRTEVRPFTDKQIELVTTFADQAVIAIENVRLFDEVQARTRDLSESLQQQTATADVLKAISRSAFDLKTVLDALVEAAARLCEADQGTIARERDGVYLRVATYGFPDDFTEYVRNLPVVPERGTATGRALLEGKVVHIPDVQADPEYTFVEAQKLGGFRTILSVPMLREGTPIGVLTLTRHDVRPFTDKQIELVSTFADQAAIAIENVRLFESVEARTRELAKSLEDLRTAQDRLVQTEKLASLGQLTAGIAHEIKNPLNFVNNFSAISVELIDELRQALAGANLDTKLRAQINEVADMLQGNLDKVVQHGKRADSIVKNMLLHSRQGSQEHRPLDINGLVEESLNLAYHGARAEKQGFNITLERSFDATAGEVDVFPQEITRVLLNLISNGFYAATKRKAEANGGNYEPTLTAVTKNLGDSVEIRIRDNGTGIPPEVKAKMFNPFFTTKPVGEGTGLGLSISHDIIVKQHGGSIEVDTQPGEFTEFRIVLPRGAATIAKSGERP